MFVVNFLLVVSLIFAATSPLVVQNLFVVRDFLTAGHSCHGIYFQTKV